MRRYATLTALCLLLLGAGCESSPPSPPDASSRPQPLDKTVPDASPETDVASEAQPEVEVSRRFVVMLTREAELPKAFGKLGALEGVTITPEALSKGVTFDAEAPCRLVDYYDTRKLELRAANILLSQSAAHERCVHLRPKPIENTEVATLTHVIPNEGECAEDRGVLAEITFSPVRRVHIRDPKWSTLTEWGPAEDGERAYQERSISVEWLGEKRDTDRMLYTSFLKYLERRYRNINLRALGDVCAAPLTTQAHTVGTIKTSTGEVPLQVVLWGKFEGEAMKVVVHELTWQLVRPSGQSCADFEAGREGELGLYKAVVAALPAEWRRTGPMEDALFASCR